MNAMIKNWAKACLVIAAVIFWPAHVDILSIEGIPTMIP